MNTKKLILLFSCIINPMNAMQGPTVTTTEAQNIHMPGAFEYWFMRTYQLIPLKAYRTAQKDLTNLEQTLLDSQTITSYHWKTYNNIISQIKLSIYPEGLPESPEFKNNLLTCIQKSSWLISQAIPQKKQILADTNRNANRWFKKSFPSCLNEDLDELKDFRFHLREIVSTLESNLNQNNPTDPKYLIRQASSPENYEISGWFEETVEKSSDAYSFTKKCLEKLDGYIARTKMTRDACKTLPGLR